MRALSKKINRFFLCLKQEKWENFELTPKTSINSTAYFDSAQPKRTPGRIFLAQNLPNQLDFVQIQTWHLEIITGKAKQLHCTVSSINDNIIHSYIYILYIIQSTYIRTS